MGTRDDLGGRCPYLGKILVLEPGKRLSLQYHEAKDETVLVQEGTLRLHLADDEGVVQVEDLTSGEHRRVLAGRTHRFEATTGRVTLVEVSTPEIDDVVRVEDELRALRYVDRLKASSS